MSNAQQSAELGRVGRLAARVRLALGMATAALVVSVVAVAIAVAALLPEAAVHQPGSWIPLGLAGLAVAGGVLVTLLARRQLDANREAALVPEVER
ncbi:MAG: hypothetical protein PVF05_13775, partial [Gemmatimonadales bacterium]